MFVRTIQVLIVAIALTACSADMQSSIAELNQRQEHAADQVRVQHLLVSFGGAGTEATRSKDEAEKLAGELFARIQNGEDFDALVKEYTDDSHPGIYTMTKQGRRGMVKGFGDVGWRLEIDEVGVAPWSAQASPYGWHIIKRLELE